LLKNITLATNSKYMGYKFDFDGVVVTFCK